MALQHRPSKTRRHTVHGTQLVVSFPGAGRVAVWLERRQWTQVTSVTVTLWRCPQWNRAPSGHRLPQSLWRCGGVRSDTQRPVDTGYLSHCDAVAVLAVIHSAQWTRVTSVTVTLWRCPQWNTAPSGHRLPQSLWRCGGVRSDTQRPVDTGYLSYYDAVTVPALTYSAQWTQVTSVTMALWRSPHWHTRPSGHRLPQSLWRCGGLRTDTRRPVDTGYLSHCDAVAVSALTHSAQWTRYLALTHNAWRCTQKTTSLPEFERWCTLEKYFICFTVIVNVGFVLCY